VAEPIRFYMDQHYPSPVSRALRRRGVDLLTAQEAGRCGVQDPAQLAFATAEERVMVTFDTDYLALHQSGVAHAGIAWCPEQKHSVGRDAEPLPQPGLLFAAEQDKGWAVDSKTVPDPKHCRRWSAHVPDGERRLGPSELDGCSVFCLATFPLPDERSGYAFAHRDKDGHCLCERTYPGAGLSHARQRGPSPGSSPRHLRR
jgi:hypothetical protein